MRRLSLVLDFFAILFAVSAVLGLLTGYDRASGYGLLAAILGSVILYLVVAHIQLTWFSARWISIILILLAAVFAVIFILQYQYQNFENLEGTPGFILRLGGFTTLLPNLNLALPHPNAAATLIIGILPFGLVLIVAKRRAIDRAFVLVASLIMGYALLLTFSRGAFIGVGAAALIALLARSRRFAVFAGAAILIGVIAFFIFYNAPNAGVLGGIFSWASSRLELYQNSSYVASDYLFTGIGLGNGFPMVYSRYGLLIQVPFLTYAHNLPLSVWLGQGLLGVIALGGLVISFYVMVIQVLRVATPRVEFYGAWIGVTATVIHGLFDARQYVESAWLMPTLFLLIGLTVATGRLAISEIPASEAPQIRSRNRLLAAGAGAIVIVLFIGAVVFNRQFAAAWNTNLGALEETEGELAPNLSDAQRLTHYEAARQYYRDALGADENWPNANRRLGNLDVNLEDFDESVALLEKAYAREPANPAAIKGLGLAYTWAGRIDDAVRMFNLTTDPLGMAQELDVWGQYRSDEKDYLLSAYAYETSETVRDSVSIPGWMRIGNTYLLAEKTDDARRWYERVLEADPNNAEAQQALNNLSPTD